jgi:hypothetical protein
MECALLHSTGVLRWAAGQLGSWAAGKLTRVPRGGAWEESVVPTA